MTRLFRFAMLGLALLLSPGCGTEETPKMVGKEVLDNLPKGEPIKPSAKASKIRAEGPAGVGSAAPKVQ